MAVPPIGGVAAAVPAVSVAAAVDAADAAGAVVAPVADAGDVAVGLADRVEKMRAELDMPPEYVEDLLRLVGTDIVVIADDSGSMNSASDNIYSVSSPTRTV